MVPVDNSQGPAFISLACDGSVRGVRGNAQSASGCRALVRGKLHHGALKLSRRLTTSPETPEFDAFREGAARTHTVVYNESDALPAGSDSGFEAWLANRPFMRRLCRALRSFP